LCTQFPIVGADCLIQHLIGLLLPLSLARYERTPVAAYFPLVLLFLDLVIVVNVLLAPNVRLEFFGAASLYVVDSRQCFERFPVRGFRSTSCGLVPVIHLYMFLAARSVYRLVFVKNLFFLFGI